MFFNASSHIRSWSRHGKEFSSCRLTILEDTRRQNNVVTTSIQRRFNVMCRLGTPPTFFNMFRFVHVWLLHIQHLLQLCTRVRWNLPSQQNNTKLIGLHLEDFLHTRRHRWTLHFEWSWRTTVTNTVFSKCNQGEWISCSCKQNNIKFIKRKNKANWTEAVEKIIAKLWYCILITPTKRIRTTLNDILWTLKRRLNDIILISCDWVVDFEDGYLYFCMSEAWKLLKHKYVPGSRFVTVAVRMSGVKRVVLGSPLWYNW